MQATSGPSRPFLVLYLCETRAQAGSRPARQAVEDTEPRQAVAPVQGVAT